MQTYIEFQDLSDDQLEMVVGGDGDATSNQGNGVGNTQTANTTGAASPATVVAVIAQINVAVIVPVIKTS